MSREVVSTTEPQKRHLAQTQSTRKTPLQNEIRRSRKAAPPDDACLYSRAEIGLPDLIIMQQVACAAGHGDASVFEHIGAVGDGERHLRVLLHEQDRDAQLMHRADDGKHLLHEHG